MILRRYGANLHSVDINFDARAMTEIGFRRNNATSIAADEFEDRYVRDELIELDAHAEGDVQDEAEQSVLSELRQKLEALDAELPAGHVLVVESEQGNDYPKTRDEKKNVLVDGENRLHFMWRVDPPLRVGRYRIR
ncbi:MAG: hypothetical protein R3E10_15300 [Gemmatimonadota bacterium]